MINRCFTFSFKLTMPFCSTLTMFWFYNGIIISLSSFHIETISGKLQIDFRVSQVNLFVLRLSPKMKNRRTGFKFSQNCFSMFVKKEDLFSKISENVFSVWEIAWKLAIFRAIFQCSRTFRAPMDGWLGYHKLLFVSMDSMYNS